MKQQIMGAQGARYCLKCDLLFNGGSRCPLCDTRGDTLDVWVREIRKEKEFLQVFDVKEEDNVYHQAIRAGLKEGTA